jgi:DNA-binding beta-propeller fold protein YncE
MLGAFRQTLQSAATNLQSAATFKEESGIMRKLAALLFAAALPACSQGGGANTAAVRTRLPTGVMLDPVGTSVRLGSFPLAMQLSPDGKYVVVLLNGWREQGFQVIERATGVVKRTVEQPAAFLGLAFSPDGGSLYVSGGNQDVIYRYDWRAGTATLRDSIVLARAWSDKPGTSYKPGTRYPAGIAVSPNGRFLFVAENLGDDLAIINLAAGEVMTRYPTQRYPYAVAVAPDRTVYVSAWGGNTVSRFSPGLISTLPRKDIVVGRHPSSLLLSQDGSQLFVALASVDRVAVVDTRTLAVRTLSGPPPGGPPEGSTPDAMALSPDERTLYVAEADNNAVAVWQLRQANGTDRLLGRIPVEWYPTALLASGDSLLVLNGKGQGTRPNPELPHPGQPDASPRERANPQHKRAFVLGQISGTLTTIVAPPRDVARLGKYSARVARANGWGARSTRPAMYPPFKHVVYIIKENRTYDQVFGDLEQADGDTTLTFFPRAVSPNHHALAERFGIFDRFFVNAEVSGDGHNWTTAAYVTDYVEKTVPAQYSKRGRSYDFEGLNRDSVPGDRNEDDVAEPANGYLWNLAQRARITFRNYGEFVAPDERQDAPRNPVHYRGLKPFLAEHSHPTYPGFDMEIPDQTRADIWIAELQQFVRAGEMPQLEIVHLPRDHTSGAKAGSHTPRAHVADNDLALGRMIEALSRTPFWKSTVVFVLEDDAQDGPDHVDSHRSPLLVISPYNRPGVVHRFANTTDVIATIAEILHLANLSQFDYYGRPLREIWSRTPDLRAYGMLKPAISLDEKNPARGPGASASTHLDLSAPDRIDDDEFNRVLWLAVKGAGVPYPGSRRMPSLEWSRGRTP